MLCMECRSRSRAHSARRHPPNIVLFSNPTMARKRYLKPNGLLWPAMMVAFIALTIGSVDADSARSDMDLIQGTWNLNELNSKGRTFGADEVDGALSVGEGQATIKVRFPDAEPYERTYKFKLYPFREPKAFDVIWEDGRVTRGIYHLEGDTWYRCHGEPDGKRPTSFENMAATDIISSLWKRPEVKPRQKPIP